MARLAKAPYGHCTCSICGRVFTARVPKGGDGSVYLPAVHKSSGAICMGSYYESEEDRS